MTGFAREVCKLKARLGTPMPDWRDRATSSRWQSNSCDMSRSFSCIREKPVAENATKPGRAFPRTSDITTKWMTRTDILRILDAHDAVWDAWWPALVRLPRSDARRSVGGSFPNVFATTRHMVAAELYWHGCMGPRVDEGPAQRAKTMRRLEAVWRELQAVRLAWLGKS
jgi:hypothetical protein